MMDKVPKKKIVSFNLSCGFLLSVRNYNCTLHDISEDGRFHMMIWQCRPWFGSAWSSSKRSSLALHTPI